MSLPDLGPVPLSRIARLGFGRRRVEAKVSRVESEGVVWPECKGGSVEPEGGPMSGGVACVMIRVLKSKYSVVTESQDPKSMAGPECPSGRGSAGSVRSSVWAGVGVSSSIRDSNAPQLCP